MVWEGGHGTTARADGELKMHTAAPGWERILAGLGQAFGLMEMKAREGEEGCGGWRGREPFAMPKLVNRLQRRDVDAGERVRW